MTEIVGVRFKKVGKVYYFSPNGIKIEKGQNVIVETARGIEMGEVVLGCKEVEDDKIVSPLKNVIRIATDEDMKVVAENEEKEKRALEICQKKVLEHKLDMNLVSAEYTFDLNKLLFYFTADGRVDFRELVKDLAAIFKTRIELRQVGVRDEAKMVGGLGICGKPLCCATFLGEFQPVSINMAKEQNLSLNPTKISGTCGRLMCCLKYEHEAYLDLIKRTPPLESIVDTPEGKGTVVDTFMLKGLCKVQLESAPDTVKVFPVDELKIIKKGKKRSVAPGEEALEEDDFIVIED